MLDFVIALLVHKGVITEDEGKKIAKSLFGRPLPSDYDSMMPFVERLVSEAKRSLERKYFDPSEFEKKQKTPESSEVEAPKKESETEVSKKTIAKKK